MLIRNRDGLSHCDVGNTERTSSLSSTRWGGRAAERSRSSPAQEPARPP